MRVALMECLLGTFSVSRRRFVQTKSLKNSSFTVSDARIRLKTRGTPVIATEFPLHDDLVPSLPVIAQPLAFVR
jgi:hypothetical protein